MLLYGLISILIIAADQISKIMISTAFTDNTRHILIPNIINIVYRKNTGAAFSMLSDHVILLGLISIIFCVGVIIFYIKRKPTHPLFCTSLALIFAGALGNGIDRIIRGYVVDFIETAFMNFPVFNIADISITIGAVLLVIYVIFYDKD